jgi:hypothetical protein
MQKSKQTNKRSNDNDDNKNKKNIIIIIIIISLTKIEEVCRIPNVCIVLPIATTVYPIKHYRLIRLINFGFSRNDLFV